ncbi:MAG: hypothetical protein K6E51_07685 [Treponema sp.]|nr:hypothetical protein [Treponema sp.]
MVSFARNEAAMIPIAEYKLLKSLDDMKERKEIFPTVQARKNIPSEYYISYEDALKQAGYSGIGV